METGSRAVLLFDGAGEQIGRIVPERQGNIAAVRMDGEKEHMVLIQETAGGAADSFHVEKGGAVEIWDVPSGKLLDAFTADGGGIDAAGILEDGSLAWSAGGETLVRRLRVPPPDETALAFLENLGCLTLDGRQELVPKVPGGSGFQVGNWSVLGDWEKARYFQEEPPLGDSGLAALASAGERRVVRPLRRSLAAAFGGRGSVRPCRIGRPIQRLRKGGGKQRKAGLPETGSGSVYRADSAADSGSRRFGGCVRVRHQNAGDAGGHDGL